MKDAYENYLAKISAVPSKTTPEEKWQKYKQKQDAAGKKLFKKWLTPQEAAFYQMVSVLLEDKEKKAALKKFLIDISSDLVKASPATDRATRPPAPR